LEDAEFWTIARFSECVPYRVFDLLWNWDRSTYRKLPGPRVLVHDQQSKVMLKFKKRKYLSTNVCSVVRSNAIWAVHTKKRRSSVTSLHDNRKNISWGEFFQRYEQPIVRQQLQTTDVRCLENHSQQMLDVIATS